ncbi:hypothetical protein [Arthrobacter flavus]|uniref:Uncharacterized protein n=1 Tax=Arthrobacter flavus TaxID=95172 RepID=A0ABW4Q7P5_9MICC
MLKEKWLAEADFTRSHDQSNITLMRLEVIAEELTEAHLDDLLGRPTVDSYGNDQEAGMLPFMEYMRAKYLEKYPFQGKAIGREQTSRLCTATLDRITGQETPTGVVVAVPDALGALTYNHLGVLPALG